MDMLLRELGASLMMIMGFSFVLGSLFTIVVLLFLDITRRNQNAK